MPLAVRAITLLPTSVHVDREVAARLEAAARPGGSAASGGCAALPGLAVLTLAAFEERLAAELLPAGSRASELTARLLVRRVLREAYPDGAAGAGGVGPGGPAGPGSTAAGGVPAGPARPGRAADARGASCPGGATGLRGAAGAAGAGSARGSAGRGRFPSDADPSRGATGYFAPLRHSPAFADHLRDLFGRFARGLVTPVQLAEIAGRLGSRLDGDPREGDRLDGDRRDSSRPDGVRLARKIRELARLYAAYEARLDRLGRGDPAARRRLLVTVLSAVEVPPPLLRGLDRIVVAGRDRWLPSDAELLAAVARFVPVEVHLPAPLPDRERVFALVNRSAGALCDAARRAAEPSAGRGVAGSGPFGVGEAGPSDPGPVAATAPAAAGSRPAREGALRLTVLRDRPCAGPDSAAPLAELCERLFRPAVVGRPGSSGPGSPAPDAGALAPLDVGEALRFVEAPGREEEVAAVVREVRRALEAGTPPEEIALVARDLDRYDHLLATALERAGVPFHFRRGTPLLETPLVRAALAFLELPARRFDLDGLLGVFGGSYTALAGSWWASPRSGGRSPALGGSGAEPGGASSTGDVRSDGTSGRSDARLGGGDTRSSTASAGTDAGPGAASGSGEMDQRAAPDGGDALPGAARGSGDAGPDAACGHDSAEPGTTCGDSGVEPGPAPGAGPRSRGSRAARDGGEAGPAGVGREVFERVLNQAGLLEGPPAVWAAALDGLAAALEAEGRRRDAAECRAVRAALIPALEAVAALDREASLGEHVARVEELLVRSGLVERAASGDDRRRRQDAAALAGLREALAELRRAEAELKGADPELRGAAAARTEAAGAEAAPAEGAAVEVDGTATVAGPSGTTSASAPPRAGTGAAAAGDGDPGGAAVADRRGEAPPGAVTPEPVMLGAATLGASTQHAAAPGEGVRLGFDAFRDLLVAAIADHFVVPAGSRPVDAVQVLAAADIAELRFDLVCLLGLAEGEFPRRLPPDPILDEREIEALALALAPYAPFETPAQARAAEPFYFYRVLSAARRRLVLSTPAEDGRGRPLLASSFLEEVARAVDPAARRRHPRGDPLAALRTAPVYVPIGRRPVPARFADCMTIAEAEARLAWLGPGLPPVAAARRAEAAAAGDAVDPAALEAALAADPGVAGRLEARRAAARLAASRDRFFAEPPGETRSGLVGPGTGALESEAARDRLRAALAPRGEIRLSASALEAHARCAYQWFLKYGVRLEPLERPARDLGSDEAGDLLHAALERGYRACAEAGLVPIGGPHDPEGRVAETLMLAKAEEVLESWAGSLRPGVPGAVREAEAGQVRQLVQAFVRDEASRAHEGFVPVAFEHRFGLSCGGRSPDDDPRPGGGEPGESHPAGDATGDDGPGARALYTGPPDVPPPAAPLRGAPSPGATSPGAAAGARSADETSPGARLPDTARPAVLPPAAMSPGAPPDAAPPDAAPPDATPPLRIPLGDGLTAVLAGAIDRIDAAPGRLRIVDYKRSSQRDRYDAQLEPESFGVRSFQVPIYLLAALELRRAEPHRFPPESAAGTAACSGPGGPGVAGASVVPGLTGTGGTIAVPGGPAVAGAAAASGTDTAAASGTDTAAASGASGATAAEGAAPAGPATGDAAAGGAQNGAAAGAGAPGTAAKTAAASRPPAPETVTLEAAFHLLKKRPDLRRRVLDDPGYFALDPATRAARRAAGLPTFADQLEALVRRALAGSYEITPDPDCGFCPYGAVCRIVTPLPVALP